MLFAIALTVALALPRTIVPDTSLVRVRPSLFVDQAMFRGIQQDTPTTTPKKHVAIDHSDAYYKRLAIHRYASYAMLPVFVGQYIAGQQLVKYSADAPQWARTGHRVLATTTAALFTLNTVTGVWNWLESRKDPDNKTLRTIHAASMLAADAGFTAVGLLANPAETNGSLRTLHKQIAYGSMGVSVASWLIMLPVFHKDDQ